jgi:Xaa-Pro aminopeptidase
VQLSRVKKSDAEIKIMQDACTISTDAFINAMKISHPYINEHLIYAKFDFDCRIRGADYLAYIPVIAGGPRATILHYIRNNQIVTNDSMVLMDAGCQYREYVSDITRTWPISGRFKNAQKELYQACLNVQKHCVEQSVPGVSIQQLYYVMVRKMGEELTNLGLIDRKEHEKAIRPTDLATDPIPMGYMQRLSNFCPHDVGHYLGLDVHGKIFRFYFSRGK